MNTFEKTMYDSTKPSLLECIPTDLIFSFTTLKFDRKHFIMFNTCCKTLLNNFKHNNCDHWEELNSTNENIRKFLGNGYRNFRLNNLEFFVVNAKIKKSQYSLYTSQGQIIHIYNNGYISITSPFYIASFRLQRLEYLKDSYPFSAKSRCLEI
jgi:hypothetical protein